MTFTRRTSLFFTHNILGSELLRIDDFINNLGFKQFRILETNFHIDMIFCEALKFLRLVMRVVKEFTLKDLIKTLYCSLVRQIHK